MADNKEGRSHKELGALFKKRTKAIRRVVDQTPQTHQDTHQGMQSTTGHYASSNGNSYADEVVVCDNLHFRHVYQIIVLVDKEPFCTESVCVVCVHVCTNACEGKVCAEMCM